MIARLERQGLDFELVDAFDENDVEVERIAPRKTNVTERRIAACLASHLQALRLFLDDDHDEAVILEDDVRLVHRFTRRLDELRSDVPATCPLVSLGYLFWHDEGFERSGSDGDRLRTMGWDFWGTQGYLVRRRWAERCLEAFHRPLDAIATDDVRTSELITRSARDLGGLVAWPPLVIEDLTGSIIDPSAGAANHHDGQARWPSTDYDA